MRSRCSAVSTTGVSITVQIPSARDLVRVADRLSTWQVDPWAGHLHPGDLGWRSLVGAAGTAEKLRVWARHDDPVAIGLLDDGVLRLGLDPAVADDAQVAARITQDLGDPRSELFESGEALVEARGARALREHLLADGWVEDEPWTPLTLDLSGEPDPRPLERTGLRIEQVGQEAADVWTSVHWSAFRGTPFDGEARRRFVGRWSTMVAGPFAHLACHLIGFDRHDVPVAVTTVWTAGPGRPGLVEPMGVHRDHHGHGYGTAITVAGALALQGAGASSANVAAENSNPASIATYRAAGFVSLGTVPDLRRV